MIVIVGCGVSGLTCAAALQDAGHRISIWARRRPPRTTSNVAAAFWYPYRAFPQERVNGWGAVSLRRFAALADDPRTGVSMRQAYDFARDELPRPWWGDAVASLRPVLPRECPDGFASGWAFEAPVIDTRQYLPWLQGRVLEAGGRIIERSLRSLNEALDEHRVVVNCSGLGARKLCADASVEPIRGQLVHVHNPGLTDVRLDEHGDGGIAYIVPRGDDCVLGGTASEADDDLAVRPDERREILARCCALEPRLLGAKVTAEVVGLRPGRDEVRLESERLGADRLVVHNYGHGGAGVTLSWGCAVDVVNLVERAVSARGQPAAIR